MCRKGTNVALTVSDQRKAMHDSPEALSQWLRDIYTTGLQSNGILLVSGSVFAEFMDAYDRVVLGHIKQPVNRYLDDAVKGSIRRVQDVQKRVGFHHGLDDPRLAPTASVADDMSNDDSVSESADSVNQTLDDAFGLSDNADHSFSDIDNSEDSQVSPGWAQPDSYDGGTDFNENSNFYSQSDSNNGLSGKVYEDSESDQAAQDEKGYADLGINMSSNSDSGFDAGIVTKDIMSGAGSILDSLSNDMSSDSLSDQIRATAQNDESQEGLSLNSQADSQPNTFLTNDGENTSLSSTLFGTTDDSDDNNADPVSDSDEDSDDFTSDLSDLMGNVSASADKANPPF